jgi:tetratricopeptide (TPR) repeat protein
MSDSLDGDTHWKPAEVARAIRHWLDQNDVQQLASLLIERGQLLVESNDHTIVQEALTALPVSWRETRPQLLFLYAQLKAQAGDYSTAIHLYEQAAQRYRDANDLSQQVQCCLNLARIYHKLEDLEAARFYTDRAHTLLSSIEPVDDLAQARLHLALARLAPDIGRMGYSGPHAEKALHLYETIGDIRGQLEAIILLPGAANQTGYPQKSLSLLRIARARCLALDNSIHWELAIGNQEAHCLWYMAKFQEAAQVAETTLHLAETIPLQDVCPVYHGSEARILANGGKSHPRIVVLHDCCGGCCPARCPA